VQIRLDSCVAQTLSRGLTELARAVLRALVLGEPLARRDSFPAEAAPHAERRTLVGVMQLIEQEALLTQPQPLGH
jgi:hypothetical protein